MTLPGSQIADAVDSLSLAIKSKESSITAMRWPSPEPDLSVVPIHLCRIPAPAESCPGGRSLASRRPGIFVAWPWSRPSAFLCLDDLDIFKRKQDSYFINASQFEFVSLDQILTRFALSIFHWTARKGTFTARGTSTAQTVVSLMQIVWVTCSGRASGPLHQVVTVFPL